jgi:tetratricopeptide (TPR) repeat protein
MKLRYASAAIVAGFLSVIPAHAAITVIGKGPEIVCFNAAVTDSGGARDISEIARRDALANCDAALADKITENDRTATLVNRAIIEAAAGKLDASLADYDSALIRDPKMANIYISRGSALLRAHRFDAARLDFDHALTLGTDSLAIAFFDRGVAQEKLNNLSAAYADYKQALALAPGFKAASAELARFHVRDQRFADSH